MNKLISIFFAVIICNTSLKAQTRNSDDTTKKMVVITSAYKPVLKPATKINFLAALPAQDTTKPTLQRYNVPAQNLFFSYLPVALKPLALPADSIPQWVNSNYVKAGFGNYSSPYAEAGLSFGDGKTSLINFFGKHISQKGSIPFQQYGHTTFNFMGLYSTNANMEWRTKIGFDNRSQYYYGFQPDTLKFEKDSLRQKYNTISGMIGLRNKEVNSLGISYDPTLTINLFSDNRSGRETSFILNAPLSKTINEEFTANIILNANITTLKNFSDTTIKNNLFSISPLLTVKKRSFTLNVGFIPSWDNGTSHILPNLTAVVRIKDEKFVVQAGWIGYYQKNSYQSLSVTNPWIRQPDSLFNTRIQEKYAGFKGSAGSHFSYNARLSLLNYNNPVLFLNDSLDGKTFSPVYESALKVLRISGEVGFTVQEKFSLLAGAAINNFSGLEINDKAWGLLPLEITGSLRWQVLKDLQFKSDLFISNGALYRTKLGTKERLGGAFDLSAGATFSVLPQLGIWLQFNNILNNKYERWHQYQVLGLNVLGGIVYSF